MYFGEESTFGQTPAGSFPNAMTRTIVSEPITADGAAVEMLDVNDVRVRRLDAIQPVHGLKIASKFAAAMNLKATPSASQLTSTHSATSLTPRLFLRHALGQEYAVHGSTVATGTSSTQFDVASGHGSRFRRGTLIAVQISGEMEWTLVTGVSTDTITVDPPLSGTPATSAIVRNLYNYAPAESHTNSLTAQIAYVGDSAAQYTFNGCHGSIKFGWGGDWGKIPSMSLDLTATNFVGPSNQSISTATATDEDPTETRPAQRWRRFGQDDHVRMYAKRDWLARLRESGWDIVELDRATFGDDVFRQHGITERSVLYVGCRRAA